MKKLFVIAAMLLSVVSVNAQNVVRSGNTFKFNTEHVDTVAKKTPYTWEDSKGKKYPVFMSSRGSMFIIRTSKAGKEYKQYLPKDVQETMRKELGINKTDK